ncbi:MAG: sugar phosphate isomerase/epimerase [Thermodesulfobacteria bacterium]|nr:sugar phosphate isomerase/epimerase [Thermodesulfobacteriota bacterium]
MELSEIKRHVFVSCPFNLLREKYLPTILKNQINPEIGLNGTILDTYIFHDFLEVARKLHSEGLKCTVHAPFTDIACGAVDSRVRSVALDRLKEAVDLAALFQARDMVFHTGWERKIYADSRELWLGFATETITALCEHAKASGVKISLENTFELDTYLHERIFEAVPKELLGFCLDAGHVYAFSKTELNQWVGALGQRITHLHLHDNNGEEDEHLVPGAGVVDFPYLFTWLSEHNIRPVLTLEAHDEESVIPGLMAVGRLVEDLWGGF